MFSKDTQTTIRDFEEDGTLVVTRRMFTENQGIPMVLRQAGPHIVRIFRDASAEYLESCIDPDNEDNIALDEPLVWTITQHVEYGVFTVHYVLYEEGHGYLGKCFFGGLGWLPRPQQAWLPLNHDGEMLARFDGSIPPTGSTEPLEQDFSLYSFSGWMPNYLKGYDVRTLCGHGFSFVKKADEALSEITTIRQGVKVLQAMVVTAGIDMANVIENNSSHKLQNANVFKFAYVRYNPENPGEAVVPLMEFIFRSGQDLPGVYFIAHTPETLAVLEKHIAAPQVGKAFSVDFTKKEDTPQLTTA